jgi:hypothetical protein
MSLRGDPSLPRPTPSQVEHFLPRTTASQADHSLPYTTPLRLAVGSSLLGRHQLAIPRYKNIA